MLFTQIEFFLIVLFTIGALLCIKSHAIKKYFMLFMSYYFYAYWDVRFTLLLFLSTSIGFFVSLKLYEINNERYRKMLIIISVSLNLCILGLFKYYNFFIESLLFILAPFNLHLTTLNLILPLGISFYTFEIISYTIDVYRGKLTPTRNIFDFALFVAFFPHLIAGPIVRASDFLPQLESPHRMNWHQVRSGIWQFTKGLFKKVFIADNLAFYVDTVFNNHSVFDTMTIWCAVISYSIQIYCDFSGYSDMAIGTARILGFELKANFDHPYIATSVSDFWRRWHISLSTWLRDYLYYPLGGNRHGRGRTHLNLMLTMTLGGLWHGASWNFIIWGAYNGIALCINKIYRDVEKIRIEQGKSSLPIPPFLGWILVMMVIITSRVFFRSESLSSAISMLQIMFNIASGTRWIYPFAIIALLILTLINVLHYTNNHRIIEPKEGNWLTPTALIVMLWLVIIFYPTGFQPFIYFQF